MPKATSPAERIIDLDAPAGYLPLDPAGMMAMCVDFPAQCHQGIALSEPFVAPAEFGQAKNVLLCGIGGSAIAGDLVSRLLPGEVKVPLVVNRQYELPGWVKKEDTLVILSSYSGNTEETINAFRQALWIGARAACITSGGELGRLAREKGVPVIEIPPGRPPRASTGFLIFPLLMILEKAGLFPPLKEQREETLALLEEMCGQLRPESPMAENPAKGIALWLQGKFPLIYGWGPLAPVAFRWQTQCNENSKALAHAGELPEMNHNEVVAWAHRSPLTASLAAIFLRSEEEPPRIRARFEITKRIIHDSLSAASGEPMLQECWAKGRSRLARQLSLLYLGDFVSLYLAFLSHKDPAEVNAINTLRGEMAKLAF